MWKHSIKSTVWYKYSQFSGGESSSFSFCLELIESVEVKMPPKRVFRKSKSASEEQAFLQKSVPSSTRYVTKWSFKVFASWQTTRSNKNPVLEEIGFKADVNKIQSLETNIVNMTADSLNFWLTKFVQEICKEDGQRYPPRSLHSIICGLQRHLDEGNGSEAVRLLDKEDRR